jgi:periplasmic protein TonB
MEIEEGVLTANDRFKEEFRAWFWYSVAMAAVFHLALFMFWPAMTAADLTMRSAELRTIELPPQIEIPPSPELIARPAAPVVSEAQVDENITIAPTTFEYNKVENLPPPPAAAPCTDDIDKAPMFVPMTVRPRLLNTAEVEQVLVKTYPSTLRDAGIGGTPILWFLIDEDGRVLQTRLHTSSGFTTLDEAAVRVAEVMRFSPALNRDRRVKVWVEIPIVFTAR